MRKERIHSAGSHSSLAELFLDKTQMAVDGSVPEEVANRERYRGQIRMYTGEDGKVHPYSDGDLNKLVTDEHGNPVYFSNWETRVQGALDFWREVTHFKPRDYQVEALQRLYGMNGKMRLALRGPRGLGKSAFAANVILHFGTVHDVCKIPTTAGSWDQLEEYLWPEIHLWHGKADWTMVGREPKMNLMDFSLGGTDDGRIKPTATAFAIKSDEPEKMEGAHSENVLIVFDEAKVIEDATYDAIEGTAMYGKKHWLAISTPGAPTTRFAMIFKERDKFPDWDVMKVGPEDLARNLPPEEAKQYLENCEIKKRLWGEHSAKYKNQILAEFADEEDDVVIPYEWVQAAVDRFKEWEAAGCPEDWLRQEEGQDPVKVLGVDMAGGGKDRTAIAKRHGRAILGVDFNARQPDTMQDANKVMMMAGNGWNRIVIENDGVGKPVADRLFEIKATNEDKYGNVTIRRFMSGSKAENRSITYDLDLYDLRSWAWYNMRELLDPSNGHDIMLPNIAELITELSTPKGETKSGQVVRQKVESKDEIRKRLKGRSTDVADAVIFAFADTKSPPSSSTVRNTTDEVIETEEGETIRTGRSIYENPEDRWSGMMERSRGYF